MEQFEAYSLLFTDSLVGNLVISLDSELIVHSMKMFGVYNNLIIVVVATIASLVATSINYFFGIMLWRIFYFYKNTQIHTNQQLLSQFFFKYNILILWLIFIPLWGKFIPLIAGFTKINFIRVLAISGVIKLCYYSYSIYII
ncbi:YqaA family protein [Rickettsia endosymbiont of Oedothorax gibbosus]|uniref:DedA family protein n=1 Tax=Rickettsia endosymbiont of Oedothorax gibbosus TaxID=931099 RepID=UPI002024CD55|nr:DedA family protein [Rickettsia endosymbiont of Oedothorax gibbosus]